MLGCTIALWSTVVVFTIHSSIVLLAAGILIYLLLVLFIEAAEQMIMQETVLCERQGRVFGFAQRLGQAASPLSVFIFSPLAQFVFIPLMSTGAGAQLIGSWYGTGSVCSPSSPPVPARAASPLPSAGSSSGPWTSESLTETEWRLWPDRV